MNDPDLEIRTCAYQEKMMKWAKENGISLLAQCAKCGRMPINHTTRHPFVEQK
jgi:hypothetical protein